MASRATIDDFLAQKRIAFVGASSDPKAFSTSVYRELKTHGYELFPVNSHAYSVDGDACFVSVAALPDDIDGVIVMVAPERSAQAAQECVDKGIPRVWFHHGVGANTATDEAVAICERHDVAVVDGACPLMFLEPAAWVHRVHRAERKLLGRLPV